MQQTEQLRDWAHLKSLSLLKNWTLKLNGRRRAFNVFTPPNWDWDMTFTHILNNHPNFDRWPKGDDTEIDLSFEYVKPGYVKDHRANRTVKPTATTQTETNKTFCQTIVVYNLIK